MTAPARTAAYEVLRRTFEHEAWTDRATAAAASRAELDERDRSFARWLAYGAVRRSGTSDYLIGALSKRRLKKIDAPVLAAVRLGIFELLWAREPGVHAVVSDCVDLARGGLTGLHKGDKRRIKAGAGFVNALLRRVAADGQAMLDAIDVSTPDGLATRHSYPKWMVAMWLDELGRAETVSLLEAMNEPAEVAFRDRRIQWTDGIQGGNLLDRSDLVVTEGGGEEVDQLVADGSLVPQSRASLAVVTVLWPQPGDRVADVCAGPGIKTAAIADAVGPAGSVVAIEPDAGRARQVEGLVGEAATLTVVEGDARTAEVGGGGFDRVLVDAPCSDLGTLASRPDARWRKTSQTVGDLARLQREILDRAVELVKPGGTLVYSTCTISRRENENNVEALLVAHPELEADDLGDEHPELASAYNHHFLQTRPDRDRTSGFFIARLRLRRAE